MFIELTTKHREKQLVLVNINHITNVVGSKVFLTRKFKLVLYDAPQNYINVNESYGEIKAKIENAFIVNNCVRTI